MTPRSAIVGAALGSVAAGAACTSLPGEARRAAEEGIDPTPVVEALAREHAAIEQTKRIFDIVLIEGRRRFHGEGALQYRVDPLRLRVDVFGPRSTPIVRVTLVGDALTVVLHQEGEVLRGHPGDPQFSRLTGERALASPEVLGALLGAYDTAALVERADRVSASADADERTLYVTADEEIHAFTIRMPEERLVEYRLARRDRLVYRVRFEEFAPVGDRESPRRVVLRDFVEDRTVAVTVTREHEDVPEDLLAGPGR